VQSLLNCFRRVSPKIEVSRLLLIFQRRMLNTVTERSLFAHALYDITFCPVSRRRFVSVPVSIPAVGSCNGAADGPSPIK
jgi:hypothetical protein